MNGSKIRDHYGAKWLTFILANTHWNAIFSTKVDPELRWYENDVSQTLKFMDLIPKAEFDTVFLPADIWIDRAVLHFLRKEADIQKYFVNLKSTIKSGGYVLLVEFSTKAPRKCGAMVVN